MAATSTRLSRLAISEGDRQLRWTCVRFGRDFREMRIRAGVSQAAVARAIGVVRSVVCRMEQGAPDVSPQIRARAVAVLGGDLRIAVYPSGEPVIHDAAHARVVESVLVTTHRSWRRTVEARVPGPGRRSTDIRLDRGRYIVLMEVETRVGAFEAIIRECADKRLAVAEAEGPDRRVHIVLVLPATRHHRALVRAHPAIVAAVFPAAPAELALALANPGAPWPGDGILWTPVLPRRTNPEH